MMYDTIIVGAGPAGCAAAYDLCQRGRSVLLLDWHTFPRAKACGGGLTIRAIQALRYSVRPVIRHVCHNLLVSKQLIHSRLLAGSHPICAMTVREEFDEFCFRKTLAVGASFQVVKHIAQVEEHETGVRLATDNGTFQAKFLIGADGADSQIRKLSGQFPQVTAALAIEARVPLAGIQSPEMTMDFGVVDQGYGWVFPRDDHLSLGLYTHSPSGHLSHRQLVEYASARLGTSIDENLIGHRIGTAGWLYRPESKRVLLVGDAAGLADPLLGEGIANAILSGQAAAFAIERELVQGAPAIQVYRQSLRPLQRDLHVSFRSARRFYGHPALGYATLTFAPVRYALLKGYALGWPLRTISRWWWTLPWRPVPRLED